MEVLVNLASVSYDAEEPTHERELKRFFAAVRSPAEARSLPSGRDARWKELGFQTDDPRTDFRGGGFLSLQSMTWLAEAYPDQTERVLRESASKTSEYLFAAACINIAMMIVLLLGLNSRPSMSPVRSMPSPANPFVRKRFAAVLCARLQGSPDSESTRAAAMDVLGELFASTVFKLHAEWRAVCARKPGATLLDFGEALTGTAVVLERLLGSLCAPAPSGLSHLGAAFSAIEGLDPRAWSTRSWNSSVRWRASLLQGVCRFFCLLAQLIDEVVPSRFSITKNKDEM